jgi:outer membrane lipoprotein-sorting protein
MPHNPTMPNNRIIPVLGVTLLVPLFAWAQAPAPGDAPKSAPASTTPTAPTAAATTPGAPGATPKIEPPTEAEKGLDEAIEKLRGLQSVSADIVEKVDMLSQHFELSGQYLKAPGYKVYLKLALSGLGDATGTMLQVSDGKTLWDYQEVLKDRQFQKLDVAKVIKRIDTPDFNQQLRTAVIQRMGFSGPESLLVGLRERLKFYRKDADTLDGKAVWVFRGEWKDPTPLVNMAQAQTQMRIGPGGALPAFIPSLAEVWVGQEDGWPYVVKLEGRRPSILEDNRQLDLNGRPMGSKSSAPKVEPSKILLTYSKVEINPKLTDTPFFFSAPSEATVIDGTDQLLIELEQQAAALQAEQRNAASKEGGVLPQQIPVPNPPADSATPTEKSGPAPLQKSAGTGK